MLNIGTSRAIPSTEYETVLGGRDFVRKVWRYARQGFVVHAHANGDALKGLLLALTAELIALALRPALLPHVPRRGHSALLPAREVVAARAALLAARSRFRAASSATARR